MLIEFFRDISASLITIALNYN